MDINSTMVSSMGCKGISTPAPGTHPPTPSSVSLVSGSHTVFLSPHTAIWYFALKYVSQRCHIHGRGDQLCPAVALLELAGGTCVLHVANPTSQRPPLQPSTAHTLTLTHSNLKYIRHINLFIVSLDMYVPGY